MLYLIIYSKILIVAKNRKYAQLFTSLFRIRKIHKTYLGIVLGELQKIKGTLVNELIHFEGKKLDKFFVVIHAPAFVFAQIVGALFAVLLASWLLKSK